MLLDVGCGGGVFLRRALETGCRAAGLDHSREMVKLAGEKNADAVRAGRLRLVEGSVEAMPFADGEFTALSCLVAFFFFPDPARALAEMRRVLDPARGRLAVYTTRRSSRGRPRRLTRSHAWPVRRERPAAQARSRRRAA